MAGDDIAMNQFQIVTDAPYVYVGLAAIRCFYIDVFYIRHHLELVHRYILLLCHNLTFKGQKIRQKK